jgi:hypothetical protein
MADGWACVIAASHAPFKCDMPLHSADCTRHMFTKVVHAQRVRQGSHAAEL